MIIESNTVPAGTFGETESAVVMRPKTDHGWRPTSVMTHPKVFAKNGNEIAGSKNFKNILLCSSLPFFQRNNPMVDNKIIPIPNPTIKRKLQYVVLTGGM